MAKKAVVKDTVNILLYGPPGVGKTTMAAKSPNPLILDFEAGTMSVRKMDVMVASPRGVDETTAIIKKAQGAGIETLILDSITELRRLLVGELMERQHKKNPSKSLFQPSMDIQVEANEQFRYIVRKAVNSGMNVVFIALETEQQDKQNGGFFFRPALSPTCAEDIYGYCSIVGRMTKKKGVRSVSFDPDERWWAKDRSGNLPEVINEDDQLSVNYILEQVLDD